MQAALIRSLLDKQLPQWQQEQQQQQQQQQQQRQVVAGLSRGAKPGQQEGAGAGGTGRDIAEGDLEGGSDREEESSSMEEDEVSLEQEEGPHGVKQGAAGPASIQVATVDSFQVTKRACGGLPAPPGLSRLGWLAAWPVQRIA
jgi:hypothetical protein